MRKTICDYSAQISRFSVDKNEDGWYFFFFFYIFVFTVFADLAYIGLLSVILYIQTTFVDHGGDPYYAYIYTVLL